MFCQPSSFSTICVVSALSFTQVSIEVDDFRLTLAGYLYVGLKLAPYCLDERQLTNSDKRVETRFKQTLRFTFTRFKQHVSDKRVDNQEQ